ncbi:COG4315 family predicted lipoprotein [Pseudomonas sp. GB2N2]
MTQYTQSLKALMLAAALSLPAMAFAAEPAMMKDGVMVDHKGMTLYTFDKDTGGKSVCTGQCAENWPPLKAEAGAKDDGKWTVVKRDDGTMQWAYMGKPLYYFMKDKKAGEKEGDNIKEVWHVITNNGPKM